MRRRRRRPGNIRQLLRLFGLSWFLLGARLRLRTGQAGLKLGTRPLLDHLKARAAGRKSGSLGGQAVVEDLLLEEVEVQSRDGAQLLVDVELVPLVRLRFSGKRRGLRVTVGSEKN